MPQASREVTDSKAKECDWTYPQPEQRDSGHLRVSVRPPHKIYWEEYGNPEGEPVMFLHGGPGAGSPPIVARFFDPDRYRIILFDQRGCGKSKPDAAKSPKSAIRDNTTGHLIEDIAKIRDHLHINGRMHVFGGSWGSTLGMAYAIKHPDQVQSLVLRGIFLGRKQDVDYFFQGNAANYHNDPDDKSIPGTYRDFPEAAHAWKHFVEVIPVMKRGDMVTAYAEIFAKTPQNQTERADQERAFTAWSTWEGVTGYFRQDISDVNKFAEPEEAKTYARIETHFSRNGFFLGGSGEANRNQQNYLLEHADSIAHLPIYIVQGEFDRVCPKTQADELVAALEQNGAEDIRNRYVVTQAGHSSLEAENVKALSRIMDELPRMRPQDREFGLLPQSNRHRGG